MKPEVSAAIHKTSAIAATIAAVLSPIPLADEIILFPVYGFLARTIGRAHGLGAGGIPWKPIAATAANGLLARAGINLAVAFIPGVAAVANASSAVVLTEFFGRYVDEACESPADAKAISVKELIARLRNARSTAAAVPAT